MNKSQSGYRKDMFRHKAQIENYNNVLNGSLGGYPGYNPMSCGGTLLNVGLDNLTYQYPKCNELTLFMVIESSVEPKFKYTGGTVHVDNPEGDIYVIYSYSLVQWISFDVPINVGSIRSIIVKKIEHIETFNEIFKNLKSVNTVIFEQTAATDNIVDFSSMFEYNLSLYVLDIRYFNTGNATSFRKMFSYCTSLEGLNTTHFDVSNISSMAQMYEKCESVEYIQMPKNITIVNPYADMNELFFGNSKMKCIDRISTLNASNIDNLFDGCNSLLYPEESDIMLIEDGSVWINDRPCPS